MLSLDSTSGIVLDGHHHAQEEVGVEGFSGAWRAARYGKGIKSPLPSPVSSAAGSPSSAASPRFRTFSPDDYDSDEGFSGAIRSCRRSADDRSRILAAAAGGGLRANGAPTVVVSSLSVAVGAADGGVVAGAPALSPARSTLMFTRSGAGDIRSPGGQDYVARRGGDRGGEGSGTNSGSSSRSSTPTFLIDSAEKGRGGNHDRAEQKMREGVIGNGNGNSNSNSNDNDNGNGNDDSKEDGGDADYYDYRSNGGGDGGGGDRGLRGGTTGAAMAARRHDRQPPDRQGRAWAAEEARGEAEVVNEERNEGGAPDEQNVSSVVRRHSLNERPTRPHAAEAQEVAQSEKARVRRHSSFK